MFDGVAEHVFIHFEVGSERGHPGTDVMWHQVSHEIDIGRCARQSRLARLLEGPRHVERRLLFGAQRALFARAALRRVPAASPYRKVARRMRS